jgi:hypothetical protein
MHGLECLKNEILERLYLGFTQAMFEEPQAYQE